ncbi:MAG: hypothetical protein HYW86_01180 [Candidatus Roizmanbacteria bacterium]|nr:MAG: hypothetical protein HYW86_01180 [Candidatus Roizmanbacteria bacterium]
MKKIIFLCLFLLLTASFLIFSPSKIYALGLSNNAAENMSGISCGIPDSSINRCCAPLSFKVDLSFDNKFLDVPLTIFRAPLEFLGNGIVMGLIDIYGKVERSITKTNGCIKGIPSTENPADPNCICSDANSSSLKSISYLCEKIVSPDEKKQCKACIIGGTANTKAGIWTAIGCVRGDLSSFIQDTVLSWGLRLAGLIALLCIIYSAFRLQVSRGNPEAIKKAQEMLTSCIMGLLLIIFSVFILRIIGVDILRIPGFG